MDPEILESLTEMLRVVTGHMQTLPLLVVVIRIESSFSGSLLAHSCKTVVKGIIFESGK